MPIELALMLGAILLVGGFKFVHSIAGYREGQGIYDAPRVKRAPGGDGSCSGVDCGEPVREYVYREGDCPAGICTATRVSQLTNAYHAHYEAQRRAKYEAQASGVPLDERTPAQVERDERRQEQADQDNFRVNWSIAYRLWQQQHQLGDGEQERRTDAQQLTDGSENIIDADFTWSNDQDLSKL